MLEGHENGEGFTRTEPRTRRISRHLHIIAVSAALLLLGGCAGGITGLELSSFNTTVCESTNNTNKICGISDDANTQFILSGQGTCASIGMNWGDGKQELINGDFAARTSRRYIYVDHQYTQRFPPEPRAWPGPKTVHAFSAANCVGEAKTRVNVLLREVDPAGVVSFSPTFKVGLAQPTPTACAVPTNTRPLRAGATVSVTERPGSPKIHFGCLGCLQDMGGSSDPIDPGFPFLGMRRHSLVLRIVAANGLTQLVQGSTQTRFVVRRDGPLEFCVNDDLLSDNTGAWGMDVTVDETTIP